MLALKLIVAGGLGVMAVMGLCLVAHVAGLLIGALCEGGPQFVEGYPMPAIDEVIEAGIEGRQARREGQTRSACPYPVGTSVGNRWLREWNAEDLRQSNGSSTHDAVSA